MRGKLKWIIVLLLLMVPAEIAHGQVDALVYGELEPWATAERNYQHRISTGFGLEAGAPYGIDFRAQMLYKWWGRHDAKIGGSFLNAESGKVLEKWHWVSADRPFDVAGLTVSPGLWFGRRAVDRIGNDSAWPKGGKLEGKWRGLGYHGGLRPTITAGKDDMWIYIRGPRIVKFGSSLAYPGFYGMAAWTPGNWQLTVDSEMGGHRGFVADGEVAYWFGPFQVGVRAGALSPPEKKDRILRAGLVVRVEPLKVDRWKWR